MKEDKNNQDSVTRRNFLKQSSTVVGGSVLGSMALNHGVFAAQNDELKVALIGCGGRGSGAADQALNTHDQGPLKLVAMADAFGDRLEGSLKNLARKHGDRVDVPEDRRFIGFMPTRRPSNWRMLSFWQPLRAFAPSTSRKLSSRANTCSWKNQ